MINPNVRNLMADYYRLIERYEQTPPDPAANGDAAPATYFLELVATIDEFMHRWAEDPAVYPLALQLALALYAWKEQQAKPLIDAKRDARLEEAAAANEQRRQMLA